MHDLLALEGHGRPRHALVVHGVLRGLALDRLGVLGASGTVLRLDHRLVRALVARRMSASAWRLDALLAARRGAEVQPLEVLLRSILVIHPSDVLHVLEPLLGMWVVLAVLVHHPTDRLRALLVCRVIQVGTLRGVDPLRHGAHLQPAQLDRVQAARLTFLFRANRGALVVRGNRGRLQILGRAAPKRRCTKRNRKSPRHGSHCFVERALGAGQQSR
mmetsp:Transcript_67147/g.194373  ORF Transcript_67147/g.194373 Transcript_67147/m.194373 type:complete len:217 (+) Transcript_67147:933-1583(+)